ncbi:polymer-forming cytoskeletal protein [Erythrobacter sp. JK5]|uniref:bactofilin family protein n=1 Tax=Erythrobacter sp. JK5 TaxID=2829500 RepID=UPI001BA7EA5B|nr:polymer-forming cytoskeletal protein [Erythrobacter sp. JK5]QUL37306.1 polymer-forming cytoskeletal protein [Erythrobacter sp. JK5]
MPNGSNSTFSVIGSDIKIKGDITASADLHVDGTIEGDIKCASLVQGESSQIMGGVHAESARFSGRVNGSITARELVILKTAEIQGDVHYDALTIEQGAQVDGRFAPNAQRKAATAPNPAARPAEQKPENGDQAQLKIAT